MKKIYKILIFLIFCFSWCKLYPQKCDGFDIEGGMVISDLDESLSFSLGEKYNYWINSYIGFSAGSLLSYSQMDLRFDSPVENDVSYYLDDNNIINLSGLIGLKLSTPTFRGFGLMSDLNFLFEPIPYNSVSVDKKYFDTNTNLIQGKGKNKFVFTQFNPAFSFQLSAFYELKQGNHKMRFAFGGGTTNYNIYNTYRKAKIDGIALKNHLKLRPDKLSTQIFLRVSGFNL